MKKILAALLFFGFAASALADDFGSRFSGNPPAAFLDGGASTFLKNIEPAAGEETAAEESQSEPAQEELVAPENENQPVEPAAGEADEQSAPGARPMNEQGPETEAIHEDMPSSNGLVRVYPQGAKK